MEVRRELEMAIDAVMTNPDPEVRGFWDEFIPNERIPTLEEFIEYISEVIRDVNI